MTNPSLPLPDFYQPDRVGEIWRVPYEARSQQARAWAETHQIQPASADQKRICLLAIDVQNTFCIPEFELFVGGKSGTGAVEDTRRLCEFVYRNLNRITTIIPTLDTHRAMQIFHPVFWVNAAGAHPVPIATQITLSDIESGVWRVNPAIATSLGYATDEPLQAHALHYTRQLTQNGKFPLTVWCYHSMLGGIGHALVPAFEEACFVHTIARNAQTQFELKGENFLTENYSILRPEVMTGAEGSPIAQKNTRLIQQLLDFDAVYIAGQAKSHCVAWTIDDLLREIQSTDPTLAQKIYLIEDASSPVVVPGVVDFTKLADTAYQRFAAAGMTLVRSTDAIGLV
jgi:nicotinamidase-related amidase